MRYLSVCSGIEAATVAWHPLEWMPAAFSEIEAFPRAVLSHHYPDVPLHGDFTTIKGNEYGPIDLLVGGTPCQSFSVAGLRGGLADDRGNLALQFLKLAQRTRPEWLLWENVPGVLSSNGGRDFGSILGGLVELGYGFAYRVLDAQHFGVPQRRRRVFVVGHLGDWRRAAAVLFERHSLSGHFAPRRETGKAVAALTADGVGTCGADDNQGQAGHLIAPTINATYGAQTGRDCETRGALISCGLGEDGETARALTACHTATLRSGSHSGSHANGGVMPAVAFAQNQRDELRTMDVAGALAAEPGMKQQTYVTIPLDPRQLRRGGTLTNSGRSDNPRSGSPGTGIGDAGDPAFTLGQTEGWVAHSSAVRRLTPRECERLQGFPDDFTLVPYRGKSAADGPRYKALGNSMAVPVMRWIGERIALVASLEEAKVAA